MYVSVVITSVRGARKVTFFAAGNMGLDGANVRLWLSTFGRGLLLKIETTLYASLYGTVSGSESIVDTECAEVVVDEDVASK